MFELGEGDAGVEAIKRARGEERGFQPHLNGDRRHQVSVSQKVLVVHPLGVWVRGEFVPQWTHGGHTALLVRESVWIWCCE